MSSASLTTSADAGELLLWGHDMNLPLIYNLLQQGDEDSGGQDDNQRPPNSSTSPMHSSKQAGLSRLS